MRTGVIPFLIAAAAGGADPAPTPGDPTLDSLGRRFWAEHLSTHPVEATALGVRRFDDRLEDISPAGLARRRAARERLLRRVRGVPEAGLSPADRITRDALIQQVESDLARLDCRLEEWVIDPLEGPQIEFLNLESFQPVRTPAEGRAMVRRWRAMGPYLDAHAANLRRGLEAGRVAVRAAVERVVQEVRSTIARPDPEWPLLNPLRVEHADWSPRERGAFREGLEGAVRESVRPALERYLRFLEAEVLPRARPEDRPGIVHLPGGVECYLRLIRVHTSLDGSPDEIHRIGLKESERIQEEIETLGGRLLGTSDRGEILRRLRADPALFFRTREEVAARAREALARAREALPAWFGVLPRAACEVIPMAEHEEAHSTIAYYRQPAEDGSRPGRYYVNTSAPESRPRYQAEALAFHEAIPGHHLQIAIAQELSGIPEFRRHTGVTAFVEGWALYAERLAGEMDLYTSDLDRLGMLTFEAWRAGRLVVDTGMHAMGWSRTEAIRFLREHTALAENNIVNEVDRYITWPGQALAYTTGQMEILRLREEARRRLGGRFDIRAFHDELLRHGAVSLSQLRQILEAWISAR
ncbi:MAG: DUF885 domain-containing protein [Acidobacteria bacterium]|nr:DUF885 domain-containing protein [Acidobacteriota bacterium]